MKKDNVRLRNNWLSQGYIEEPLRESKYDKPQIFGGL